MARAKVLLLITGGIAAYKSCVLTRLLIQAGFSVRVAMTEAAQRFVGPVTLRALSGHGVATDLWGEGDTEPLDHVELAQWADLTVVAPATANLLGKAAGGIADDIVSTLLLANTAPLILAPAMNDAMWAHAAVQQNLTVLRKRGADVVGPGRGYLACGTEADGRMAEPEEICARVCAHAHTLPPRSIEGSGNGNLPLAGRRVLITAGPTHEPLDAIRYLSNRSSGAMGFALARQAVMMGADVSLIHGPVTLPPPCTVPKVTAVETAAQMADAVREQLPGCDVLMMSAAVADYSPRDVAEGKTKKESLGTSWKIEMSRTTDILSDIVDKTERPDLMVVGFALETEDVIQRATDKMKVKGMDFIVANRHSADRSAFGQGAHQVSLIGPDGIVWQSDESDKDSIASGLWLCLAPYLHLASSDS